MTILGIDPGGSGGLALVCNAAGESFARVYAMPPTTRDIWLLVRELGRDADKAIIEKVGVMPGQGIASGFKFGCGYGGLLMALTAADVPYSTVAPAKWQRAVGVVPRGTKTKTQHKNALKARAQELAPTVKFTLKTADAYLLACYGLL